MNSKYFKQLQKATSDVIVQAQGSCPALMGNFVRLANLAAGGVTTETERVAIAQALDNKGDQYHVRNIRNLRETASSIRNRWQNRQRYRSPARKEVTRS